jgi:hypothetical protein
MIDGKRGARSPRSTIPPTKTADRPKSARPRAVVRLLRARAGRGTMCRTGPRRCASHTTRSVHPNPIGRLAPFWIVVEEMEVVGPAIAAHPING